MFGALSIVPAVGRGRLLWLPRYHFRITCGEVPGPRIDRSPARQREGSRGTPSYLTDLSTVNQKCDLDHEKRLKECDSLT